MRGPASSAGGGPGRAGGPGGRGRRQPSATTRRVPGSSGGEPSVPLNHAASSDARLLFRGNRPPPSPSPCGYGVQRSLTADWRFILGSSQRDSMLPIEADASIGLSLRSSVSFFDEPEETRTAPRTAPRRRRPTGGGGGRSPRAANSQAILVRRVVLAVVIVVAIVLIAVLVTASSQDALNVITIYTTLYNGGRLSAANRKVARSWAPGKAKPASQRWRTGVV